MNTSIPFSCSAIDEGIEDFSFSIIDHIDGVPEIQWNAMIPESNQLMQFDQMKLIETSQQEKMRFKYAFVRKDDHTVGAIYFQVVRFTGTDLLNYFPKEPEAGLKKYLYRFARGISEPFIRRVDLKLLVSGNAFMTGENGFYFHSDIDKMTKAKLVRETVKEIVKADPGIRAVLIGDLYEPKSEFDTLFKKCGYSEITVEADMSLKIHADWKTFDDYVNDLSSKYRVRAKKVLLQCRNYQVEKRELSLEEIGNYENRLYELYEKVMSRAEFKLATLAKDFFCLQKKTSGDSYRVFAYFRDNEMIGFISAFLIGKKMEVHYTGMEKEISKKIGLYQQMLYDMVALGISAKAERLHFGRTAPEIKSTIGAAPSPMYGYVKHFNPLFNFLMVRTFTANLKPKQYTIRDPFKKTDA